MRTTGTVLDTIFARKREEVEALLPTFADVRARAADAGPVRPFHDALRKGGPALIAEVKRASPSEGVIREPFDVAEIARAYERAGAAALSVLTDVDFFGGGLENLFLAREACELPLLRKDFIYHPHQVHEARAAGADAVLLILAMLEDPLARDLHAEAVSLGMAVLVETHTDEEVDRALAMDARIVGVNSRDLSTFETDLAIGERLLPRLKGRVAVAESALKSRADVDRMVAAGAGAVLIGTEFMRERDIEASVRRVMGPR